MNFGSRDGGGRGHGRFATGTDEGVRAHTVRAAGGLGFGGFAGLGLHGPGFGCLLPGIPRSGGCWALRVCTGSLTRRGVRTAWAIASCSGVGKAESADDQGGAFDVDGVAHEGVDDLHQCVLDGLFVFDHGDGMEARLWRAADAAVGVLVEVAELLSAKSGGVATDSGGLDMSAAATIGHGIYLL